MKIDFISCYNSLTLYFNESELKELKNQGIDFDDWDYMLVMKFNLNVFNADNTPKNNDLDKFLHGCCDNKWYRVKIKDEWLIIGVAYHA